MAIKNQSITIQYVAWDTFNNVGKTGDVSNHTLRIVTDGTSAAPANSPSEIDATNIPGIYKITLTAGEMNSNVITLGGKSSTANVVIIPVQITTERGDVTGVRAKTDQLAFAVANQVDSNTKSISDDSVAADRLEALMDGIVVAQVNGAASTTSIPADGFTEATNDHFKGRLITFVTGALSGQQTNITTYAGGTQTFTVTALTEAPADNDFFVIH